MSQWKWCVEDSDGKTVKGWYNDNGTWYYLNDEGIMQTGWVQDKDGRWYYLNNDGSMKTGWFQDQDKWYYLQETSDGYKGAMYSNGTFTIDGKSYSFDEKGAWIEDNQVSADGIKFIESWEGYIGKKYDDGTGVCTQGYGMTGKEISDLPNYIDQPTAEKLLIDWLKRKYTPVIVNDLNSKGITLKQNQLDALVSFAYNVGTAGCLGSELYKYICSGGRDADRVQALFLNWSRAGNLGNILKRRRISEANLFNYADYSGNC